MRNRLFRFNEPPGDRATHPVKLDFREGRVRIKCLDLIKLGAGRERRRCGGGTLENRRLRVADVVGDYPSIGTGSGYRSKINTSLRHQPTSPRSEERRLGQSGGNTWRTR